MGTDENLALQILHILIEFRSPLDSLEWSQGSAGTTH